MYLLNVHQMLFVKYSIVLQIYSQMEFVIWRWIHRWEFQWIQIITYRFTLNQTQHTQTKNLYGEERWRGRERQRVKQNEQKKNIEKKLIKM